MLFSFVKIVTMNKMCKNHELLLATELIFCNNPKTNIGFLSSDAHLWVGLQKSSICIYIYVL